MCGRYAFTKVDEFGERYGLEYEPEDLYENFNAAPTQTMPVVTERDGKRKIEMMRWGIPRFIGPGKVKDVFNTRADKAFSSWKRLTLSQRVLVPASGFYEWKRISDGKQPYFIKLKDNQLLSFAGIWSEWENETGGVKSAFSIITTEPNKDMSSIHNRMPVILHKWDESEWLNQSHNNDQELLNSLLLPYDDNELRLNQVSKDVNVVSTNEERLMYPINTQ